MKLHPRLLQKGLKEIQKRFNNGVLTTPTGWFTNSPEARVTSYNKNTGYFVINNSYWYRYTNRKNYICGASYLCGTDDTFFAVRIPSNLKTIIEAINWLTPNEIKVAKQCGKWTGRQGDMFFKEVKRKSNFTAMEDTRHQAFSGDDYGCICIAHPEHTTLIIPSRIKAVKAIRGKQINGLTGD